MLSKLRRKLFKRVRAGKPARDAVTASESAMVGEQEDENEDEQEVVEEEVVEEEEEEEEEEEDATPTTSQPEPAELQALDPIARPAYCNRTSSPLLRLPEELLVNIITRLDIPDIMCLRWSSRTFLRITGTTDFLPVEENIYYIWPYLAPVDPLWRRRGQVRSRLFRDSYCTPCRGVWLSGRGDPRYKALIQTTLPCSGCRANHPALYFSPANRVPGRKSPRPRPCIAHQGHVRICQHVTVGWQDAARWLDPIDDPARDLAPSIVSLCEHASHASHCTARKSEPDDYGTILARVQKSTLGADITIQRQSHVAPVYDRRPGQSSFNAAALRSALRGLYDDAGRFLIPEPSPETLSQRMRVVDPNICRCARYDGLDSLPLRTSGHRWDSCRGVGGRSDLSHSIITSHGGSIRYRSEDNVTPFFIFRPCKRRRQCGTGMRVNEWFKFKLSAEQVRERTPPAAWFTAMDPDSYGLRKDAGTKHVLWCLDRGCRNYYKHVRTSRFTRVAKDWKGGY